MDVDYASNEALSLYKGGYIHDSDLIPRRSTASATVFQGVKKGENPELTTMWVALGYPPVSVAMPAWVKAGESNPSLLLRNEDTRTSKMCEMVLQLKETVYDVKRGHGAEYMHFSKIFNAAGTGYMQQLAPVENSIFDEVNPLIEKWRKNNAVSVPEIKQTGAFLSKKVEEAYSNLK